MRLKPSKKESPAPADLDRIDRRLLRLLQSDGRLSNAELAKKVNVSPATCHRRMRRLFEDGYVRVVRAIVAPERVERGALVVVGLVLDRSTPDGLGASGPATGKFPFTPDSPLGAGAFDFSLKTRVRDTADFNRLHGEQLIALPGVRQTRT